VKGKVLGYCALLSPPHLPTIAQLSSLILYSSHPCPKQVVYLYHHLLCTMLWQWGVYVAGAGGVVNKEPDAAVAESFHMKSSSPKSSSYARVSAAVDTFLVATRATFVFAALDFFVPFSANFSSFIFSFPSVVMVLAIFLI